MGLPKSNSIILIVYHLQIRQTKRRKKKIHTIYIIHIIIKKSAKPKGCNAYLRLSCRYHHGNICLFSCVITYMYIHKLKSYHKKGLKSPGRESIERIFSL